MVEIIIQSLKRLLNGGLMRSLGKVMMQNPSVLQNRASFSNFAFSWWW